MCKSIRIISQSRYGQLSKCEKCNSFNLTYNNILFEFTNEEFENFKRFLNALELESCKKRYNISYRRRNIPVQTYQQNLFLVFSSKEIKELMKLVAINNDTNTNSDIENYELLSFNKIDYKLQSN